MFLYSISMIVTAIILIVLSVLIYKGNTNLIHEYHQTKVKDKMAYGKAYGKSLSIIAGTLLLSGIIGLFGESKTVALIALIELVIGMSVGIGSIIATQKKYNNGLF